MIDSMGLKMITIVPDSWGLALLRRLLVSAIIAGPFVLGAIHGFTIGNIPLWASLFMMFVLGLYFIFKGVMRYRRDLHIT